MCSVHNLSVFLFGPAAIFRADCWIRPTETRLNLKGSVQLWQL